MDGIQLHSKQDQNKTNKGLKEPLMTNNQSSNSSKSHDDAEKGVKPEDKTKSGTNTSIPEEINLKRIIQSYIPNEIVIGITVICTMLDGVFDNSIMECNASGEWQTFLSVFMMGLFSAIILSLRKFPTIVDDITVDKKYSIDMNSDSYLWFVLLELIFTMIYCGLWFIVLTPSFMVCFVSYEKVNQSVDNDEFRLINIFRFIVGCLVLPVVEAIHLEAGRCIGGDGKTKNGCMRFLRCIACCCIWDRKKIG